MEEGRDPWVEVGAYRHEGKANHSSSRMSKNGKARPIYADDLVYRVLEGQKQRQIEDGAEFFPLVFHRMRSTGEVGRRERKTLTLNGLETSKRFG